MRSLILPKINKMKILGIITNDGQSSRTDTIYLNTCGDDH